MKTKQEKIEAIKKLVAGVFFIVGIVALIFVVFTIGKNKGLTEKKFQVQVLFKEVGGLIEGAPVRLAGVTVGSVDSISFLDQEINGRRVDVRVNIYEKFRRQLNNNARFSVETEGLLGGKLIQITILEGDPISLDQPMLGQGPLKVEELAEIFSGAIESFSSLSNNLNQIDFKSLSESLEETAVSVENSSVKLNELLVELDYITKKSRRILDRVEKQVIEGTLFKVF